MQLLSFYCLGIVLGTAFFAGCRQTMLRALGQPRAATVFLMMGLFACLSVVLTAACAGRADTYPIGLLTAMLWSTFDVALVNIARGRKRASQSRFKSQAAAAPFAGSGQPAVREPHVRSKALPWLQRALGYAHIIAALILIFPGVAFAIAAFNAMPPWHQASASLATVAAATGKDSRHAADAANSVPK